MSKSKLLWIPRTLTIVFIVFLSVFSLDVFSDEGLLIPMIGGFLIHNIPSFLLIIILIISWKRPFISGVAFVLFGLLSIIFFRTTKNLFSFLFISLLSVIIGGLYLLCYLTPKKAEHLKGA
jgi:hypothetical protein